MRGILILVAGLFGAGLVGAAPRSLPAPPPPPPTEVALLAEAQSFAQQLLLLTGQITDQYVRPVERPDLLYAALSGVYEAARIPVPRDLRARLLKAEAADKPPGLKAAGAPGIPLDALGDRAVAEAIEQVRVEVAGSEFLQGQNVLLIACRALGRSLDPYTVPVTAEEQRHAVGLNQYYDGVGLELEDVVAGRARVRTVHPGSPAQQAGLRPGDEITHLDGKPVAEVPANTLRAVFQQGLPDDIVQVERAAPPEPVKVRMQRPGGKAPREVSLTGRRFRPETVWGVTRREDNSWDFWLDRRRRIAHVRVGPLAKGTAEELYGVLANLRDNGMKGLVLDLRWCPGGFLNEAANCAELFVGNVVVATVKSRNEGERVFRSTGQHRLDDFPVVLLVNGETSGGGELIAASLKDHNRVRVAGQRTLGKASVQTPFFLGTAGLGMKVTSGTFLRPSGKNLHRFPDSKESDDWGVRPDEGLEMRLSADLGRQLKQWWLWQTLRPGPSDEALPLDDPENDPQRQTALAGLVEQVERKVGARD